MKSVPCVQMATTCARADDARKSDPQQAANEFHVHVLTFYLHVRRNTDGLKIFLLFFEAGIATVKECVQTVVRSPMFLRLKRFRAIRNWAKVHKCEILFST